MEQLNVAVIGCGRHAQSHFGMIAEEPRVRLAAIAEVDSERLEKATAEHKPERAFTDYRKMLDVCEIDVAYVITMPGHILPIALDCFERDIHTSVEKSPGMSSAETRRLAEAAHISKAKGIVSFNRRYFPEVLAVRAMVRERGGTVHCAATYNKNLRRMTGDAREEGILPDPIIGDGIHHVDLLRWLAGSTEDEAAKPVDVYSEFVQRDAPYDQSQNAVVRFNTGAIGVLMAHFGVGARIQRAETHARNFSAYLDLTDSRNLELFQAIRNPDGGTDPTPIERPLDFRPVAGPNFNETRHFVDCILEDRPTWSNLDDAVVTMELCEAIRRGHKGPLS